MWWSARTAFTRWSAQTLWLGPGHHLVHYPISAGRLVNLVAFAPAGDYTTESWTATATVGELLAEFAGWDDRLTGLIAAAGTPGRWALLDRAPLRRWTRGTSTLLGDAAHPMFPFFAQGAAQAIEDAAALARCLAADPAEPAAALRRYEELRIPRTTRLQQVSHARADLNHLADGPGQVVETDPLAASAWIYDYNPDTPLPSLSPADLRGPARPAVPGWPARVSYRRDRPRTGWASLTRTAPLLRGWRSTRRRW
jgi:salicylate hydroxylase